MNSQKREAFANWLQNQGYSKESVRNYPYRAERVMGRESGSLDSIIAGYESTINNPSGNHEKPRESSLVSIGTLKAYRAALKKYREFCEENK